MRDPISVQYTQNILVVLDDRFGHYATLITSQVPVTDWHLRIPDPNPTLADAVLDHLVHNAQFMTKNRIRKPVQKSCSQMISM